MTRMHGAGPDPHAPSAPRGSPDDPGRHPSPASSPRDSDPDAARRLIVLGAALGASGVALGAFGAHALRARISPEMLEIYRTGVLSQLVHAIALLGVAGFTDRLRRPLLTLALFGGGVFVFSGSLYALAATGARTWGAVTPVGGIALIAGWLSILFGLRRRLP
jgi:uncharacterized membrane protein YgdD (TMEM256/DUF423 family)